MAIELYGDDAARFETKAMLEVKKYNKRVELNIFLNWVLKNYISDTDDGIAYFRDNYGLETSAVDIASKYVESIVK